MLAAIIELPHTAISRYNRLIHIINVVFTHNRNRTLANLCEVVNHSLHRNTLSDGYFCVAMLYLDDYVFFVVVLNQAVYVCWVYATIKAKTFEVDELFHPLWIQDFAFHKQSPQTAAQTYSGCAFGGPPPMEMKSTKNRIATNRYWRNQLSMCGHLSARHHTAGVPLLTEAHIFAFWHEVIVNYVFPLIGILAECCTVVGE